MLKTKSNKSVIRIFLFCLVLVSFLITAIMGYLWISNEFQQFEQESQRMRREYVESQKLLIKNEVLRVMDYITYVRSNTDLRLKESLKERVYEAYTIAAAIYNKYRYLKSNHQIKQLIKDALRHIRFSKGRGYFYIYTLEGVLELYPVKPHIEGENQWNLQDKHGVYVVRNEIELVKKQQEGFLEYTWKAPQDNLEVVPTKVSFVKYFKPFNWYIGSKEYREDFTQDIQRELLERIGKIRFGKNGYIFVVDFEGVTLWNDIRPDLIGKKVWVTEVPGGLEAVRQAREAAGNPQGGFIEYTWFKRQENVPIRKASFVMGIKEWQWIIGAGVYLDEIDRVIANNRIDLKKQVIRQVIKIIGLFFLIFTIVFFITLLFSGKLRKEFDVFLSFFRKSAVSHEKIDKDKLFAEEFKSLADSANQMLEERQKIENSLRESEERLAVTFRSLAEGVITTDTEQKVVLINRSAEKLMGWTQEEAQGKPLDEVFKIIDKQAPEVQHPLEVDAEAGPFLAARDGTQRLISHSSAPIRDTKGNVIGSVIVFQDITEKKRMEEELLRAHKLEALGLLAGGIAHDFNNLLTGIMGNISLAKATSSPGDKIYKRLVQAEETTVKTKQLTQQLLTFARGGAPVKKVHTVSDLVRESVSFALRGSNVKCEFTLSGDLWAVEVDEDQINQVLDNLIINAVQAMPEGGTINVSADNVSSGKDTGLPLAPRKYVKIAVRDHGTGIPQELQKKIFDPYFSTKPKGSGLGLASAYSIIKKHEGYIDVESQPGKGSTFTIYIPASHKEVPTPAPETTGKRLEEEIMKGDKSERVLVMDDEGVVGDVVASMLIFLGYRPEVVPGGGEAVREYKKALEMNRPFKVVLMDLTIPGGMGGAETIKKLLEIDPHVRAIVSSGYSNDPIMANFKKHGFRACIKKPYQLKDLKRTLKQVMR
ncbi:MAG: cache domain-containing protein [Candidatus Aminicenantes bacterium]|nr:MAG: cache domain-containing protein [Candidatus Aminicenantes bacterium]